MTTVANREFLVLSTTLIHNCTGEQETYTLSTRARGLTMKEGRCAVCSRGELHPHNVGYHCPSAAEKDIRMLLHFRRTTRQSQMSLGQFTRHCLIIKNTLLIYEVS